MLKRVAKRSPEEPEFLPKVLRITSLAARFKAIDIKAYDVRGLTLIADSFVLCAAASEPQFRAIYKGVREGMKEAGIAPLNAEGNFRGAWLVLDYGTVIVHIFREEAREFYDLDGLWSDAPLIDLGLDG